MSARIAAFCCGVIILYSGWMAPEPWVLAALLALTGLVVLRWRCGPGTGRDLLVSFFVGLLLSALTASWHRLAVLPPSLEGVPVEVSGYLCEVPSPAAFGGVRFSLCVTDWHLPAEYAGKGPLPRRLKLTAYGDQATLDIPSPMRATLSLKRPHGAVNPGGFRYETWLFRQTFGATGTVRGLESEHARCGLQCQYHRYRAGLVRSLEERLGALDNHPLALSLMVGYRGGLANDD